MSINDTSAVIYPDVDLPEFNAIDRKSKDNGDILYILVPKDRPEVCPECGSVSVHVHRSCKIHSGQRSGLYSRSGTPSSFPLRSVSSIRLLSKNGHKKTPQVFVPMASVWSNRKGIPLMKTVSLLCKLIQF